MSDLREFPIGSSHPPVNPDPIWCPPELQGRRQAAQPRECAPTQMREESHVAHRLSEISREDGFGSWTVFDALRRSALAFGRLLEGQR